MLLVTILPRSVHSSRPTFPADGWNSSSTGSATDRGADSHKTANNATMGAARTTAMRWSQPGRRAAEPGDGLPGRRPVIRGIGHCDPEAPQLDGESAGVRRLAGLERRGGVPEAKPEPEV